MFKLNCIIFFLILVKDNQWVLAELSSETADGVNTLRSSPFEVGILCKGIENGFLQTYLGQYFKPCNMTQQVLQQMQSILPTDLPLFSGLLAQYKPSSQQHQPRSQPLVEEKAGNCTKSSGSGLTDLIKQAKALLPLKTIQQLIVDSATNDQEVRSILQLVKTDSLLDRLQTIRHTSEYTDLLDYMCQMVHINPKEMADFVKNFALVTSEVKPSAGAFKGRPGIRGLLQDIRDVLPQQQLKDLYADLIKSDSNLRETVQRLKSLEFRQLVRNLRGLEAYQEVSEALVNAGVPLREWREMISSALGWSGLQFVSF